MGHILMPYWFKCVSYVHALSSRKSFTRHRVNIFEHVILAVYVKSALQVLWLPRLKCNFLQVSLRHNLEVLEICAHVASNIDSY